MPARDPWQTRPKYASCLRPPRERLCVFVRCVRSHAAVAHEDTVLPHLRPFSRAAGSGIPLALPVAVGSRCSSLDDRRHRVRRLAMNVRLATAQQELALIDYQRVIQTAFRQVSDSLIQYRKVREIRAQQELLVATLQERSSEPVFTRACHRDRPAASSSYYECAK